ncbi:MAG: hypothetical protein V4638_06870 [Bacteroidota bacterium]
MKALQSKLALFFILIGTSAWAQTDTSAYNSYKEKIVLYTDIGFSTSPFAIKTEFSELTKKLQYRNNFKLAFGFGIAYKWFGFRLGISAFNMLPSSKYGKSQQFNLGVDFTIKKMYFDIDFRNLKGYAVKNAYKWNDSLSSQQPHDTLATINTSSFSINSWYFHDKNFKISTVKGLKGNYKRPVHTWYVKGTLNFFGVTNTGAPVIPLEIADSSSTKSFSTYYSAFDFGALPGYAYVNRIKNWQFAAALGFGAVIQSKFHEINNKNQTFIGLAPRYDIKLYGGYNTEKWFVMLLTDFDNKSIHYNDVSYSQFFYTLRLTAGIRFDKKEKKK